MTILPQENYAISMDIGTGKIALGFAKPIDPGMPIEAVTLNSGSNTTVIDSTNLTELLKEAVQNQLPSAEYRAKSNTDTMHEICEAMLTLLREVFQLAEREHPDAFEEKYKDGSHHFVPLFSSSSFFLLFFSLPPSAFPNAAPPHTRRVTSFTWRFLFIFVLIVLIGC